MAEELEFEYDVKSIPVDAKFNDTVAQLIKDGWQIVQGVKPVAIYHVIRQKTPAPSFGGGLGVITIDESKVHILRKDGTLDKGFGQG
jgi:hypothetical protein